MSIGVEFYNVGAAQQTVVNEFRAVMDRLSTGDALAFRQIMENAIKDGAFLRQRYQHGQVMAKDVDGLPKSIADEATSKLSELVEVASGATMNTRIAKDIGTAASEAGYNVHPFSVSKQFVGPAYQR